MAIESLQMKVSGLMCSFCTMSVEKALRRNEGIRSVLVNLVHGVVVVEADTSLISREQVAAAIERMGYSVSQTEVQQYAADDALFSVIKTRGTVGMALAVLDLLIDPMNLFGLDARLRALISLVIAAVVLLWVGAPIARKTLLAVRQRVINANVLLSAAAWGSFVVGGLHLIDPRWPNFLPVAAWLMSLHLFFGYFKLDTRKKAAEAVRKLLSLQPARARVVRGGNEVDVLTEEVLVGEIVAVRPGERIPLDGEVVAGVASVDQSSFTGESVPVTKRVGEEVIGGTLNLDGALQIRASSVGQNSVLSQIVRLMVQISERKPPVELLADRLMNYYGPVVFAVAAIAGAGWFLVTGNAIEATLALVTTVIMGYPCALGITTPMLAAIAGGRGVSMGFLVKASEVFYELSRVDTVAFDKTGTLTYGRPTVTDVVGLGAGPTEILGIAASVEAHSEHPLGQAIVYFGRREGAEVRACENFRAHPGLGVSGRIDDAEVTVGKPSFLIERGITIPEAAEEQLEVLSTEGKSVVLVAKDGHLLGVIALQDTPRRTARTAIARLRESGIKTVMLTGDSASVASAIGRHLGIDEVAAELMPAQKVAELERMQHGGRRVAMVGDGINDAPALAQANVGIAIAAGTDVAIESAGVILVGDRLDDVSAALKLGKVSYRTMTANVVIAVVFNLLGMTAAAAGLITPALAIVVMVASIFAILLNTLRVRSMDFGRAAIEEQGELQEVEYLVPKMVCEGCAETISAALMPLEGVRAVRPKVPQKHVVVQYAPSSIREEQIRGAMEKAGFQVLEA